MAAPQSAGIEHTPSSTREGCIKTQRENHLCAGYEALCRSFRGIFAWHFVICKDSTGTVGL